MTKYYSRDNLQRKASSRRLSKSRSFFANPKKSSLLPIESYLPFGGFIGEALEQKPRSIGARIRDYVTGDIPGTIPSGIREEIEYIGQHMYRPQMSLEEYGGEIGYDPIRMLEIGAETIGGGAPGGLPRGTTGAGMFIGAKAKGSFKGIIKAAYDTLKAEKGYSFVEIADLRDRLGITQPEMEKIIRANPEKMQLAGGDWSLSDERVRSGGVWVRGRPMEREDRLDLLVKVTGDVEFKGGKIKPKETVEPVSRPEIVPKSNLDIQERNGSWFVLEGGKDIARFEELDQAYNFIKRLQGK